MAGLVISNSLAEFGVVGNEINFLGVDVATAALIVSLMNGMKSFMAIVGDAIAGACISRYFVVLSSTSLFIYGLLLFSLSILSEDNKGQVAPICIALAFIAAGQGGQERTLRKFGADQFKEHMDCKDRAKRHSAAWWYLGVFLGAFLAATAGSGLEVPPVEASQSVDDNKCRFYEKMLLLSTVITMVVAFYVAVLGILSYHNAPPRPISVLCMLRVLVATAWKIRLDYPADESKICKSVNRNCRMNENDIISNVHATETPFLAKYGADQESFWLPHTNRLRWLDKASIIDDPEAAQESKWRLCTQTEVEATKCLLRLFPFWATFLMYGMVLSLGETLFIAQAGTLNRKLGRRFKSPITFLLALGDTTFIAEANALTRKLGSRAQIPITFVLAVSGLSKLFLTKACLLFLNWCTASASGASPRIRIGAGFILSILCCLIASFVERKRWKVLKKTRKVDMSIIWLVPQFCALGAMDGLIEDGIEGLFVDEVPKQLRRCNRSFRDSAEGVGSMLGALMISVAQQIWPDWFDDHMNVSHVDGYYFLFFVLSLINLLGYGFVASRYPHQSNSIEVIQVEKNPKWHPLRQ